MPLFLPLHELSGLLQLSAIEVCTLTSQAEVLEVEVERIHVQLGSHVIQSSEGQPASLRMIGGAPGSLWTRVGCDGRMFLANVWNVKNVRNRRHAPSTRAASGPRLMLP